MKFKIRKDAILRNLFIAIGLLLIGNLLSLYLLFNSVGMDSKIPRLIIKLLNFNLEANLPTYFSSLILLANAVLLAIIGFGVKSKGSKYWYWIGLSCIFVFLALDEMIQIHEQLRAPIEQLLGTTGILYFAWFIPYLIFTFLVGIAYFKFIMGLPKHVLKLFILAAVLFLSGAVIVEAISGMYSEDYGEKTLAYALMYSFEELLEMCGSVVFFYALMVHISYEFKQLKLTFESKKIKNKKKRVMVEA